MSDVPLLASRDFSARFGIPELIPLRLEKSRHTPLGNRLNLVIPRISRDRSFGGIATALRFFERLSAEFQYTRMVVTHESSSQFEPSGCPDWILDRGDIDPRSIKFLGDQDACLSISPTDHFLATFWSTAIYVNDIISFQQNAFSSSNRRFVYLIQDYEPGFYPPSFQSVCAERSYRDPSRVIAVFNSQDLADYFNNEGLHFPARYVYKPMLHPRLQQTRRAVEGYPKERMIFVYARPLAPRNGFGLITEALRIWASTFPAASKWSLVSDGDRHDDVPLGEHTFLRSRAKASLDEYAHYLSRSWIGLAFVFTAGPSYAVYDIAEFGGWAITNRGKFKDPSRLARNIVCVDNLSPEAVAKRLIWCCEQYRPHKAAVLPDFGGAFRCHGEEFPFVPDLIRYWTQRE